MKITANPPETTPTLERRLGGLIDAHVHLWTNDFRKYPLAEGRTPAEMKPPVFSDILRYARPEKVTRIVLIQVSYYGFDNSYMLSRIRQQPRTFRGVAMIDWHGNNPEAKMRELARRGVRGFRVVPHEASDLLEGNGLDRMFRYGARENLAMCFLIGPQMLPALRRQCEKFPATPVVIDHLARIGLKGPITQSHIRALTVLANCPAVKVKVSAFYALGRKRPPHKDLIPFIHQVFDAFGPRRLMWGSDSPFQLQNETYEDSLGLVRDHLDFLSWEDKEWLLRRTAEETFFTGRSA